MKSLQILTSLSRAFPFSNFFRKIVAVKGRSIENCSNYHFNDVGLKYLTTVARRGEAAVEIRFTTAKTSVWWDIENCEVPKGRDGHKIAKNIESVLREKNYCGSLAIHAYGDTNKIPSSVQQALSFTGVSLNHVPSGEKDGSDKKIIVDMLLWAMENQAPANIMLISGDGDFSYVLHQLRLNKYNILLVRPDNASRFLIDAANTILSYTSIVGSEVPTNAESGKQMRSDLAVGSKKSQKYCEICKVSSTSLVDFNSHLSGKKHKKKVKQVEALWCIICKVSVPKGGNKVHTSGRRHINKLKIQTGDSH